MQFPILARLVVVFWFITHLYKNITTRTFEHRGEAWQVLVGAKVQLSPEINKLFEGKADLTHNRVVDS